MDSGLALAKALKSRRDFWCIRSRGALQDWNDAQVMVVLVEQGWKEAR